MKHARGFTLIEFVIVITLIGILSAVASMILNQHFKGYFSAKDLMALEIKTNMAADNLLRELKSSENLTALSATSLSFVNQQGESIVINVSNGLLRRQVNSATAQTLCNNVTSLAFAAFDSAFASTAVTDNIRFVTMSITTTDNNTLPYSLMAGTVLRTKLMN